ncbi:MAG: peptidoglycan editing factor PgeF [Candidatus Melainabacteria bacterium]|nr:MAG: peptidoglycan editing factor PgeF [Candidatus Melainabacteria bacterium]RAI11147.1 MAG: peptidoglycan editing factor PgeF [Candidatus Melainabacteria bacterium]
MFYLDKLHGKTIMKTDILEGLTHYFTTRECPIKSKEPEMQNIIEENRKMFCEELGITQENFIYPEQRHTDTVAVAELGKTYYPEADALILTNHEQAVFLNFADCTPLIAYDKKQNIGAVIHAGWKGTVGRIGTKTILKMMDDFNTDIRDVRVAIGPAISVCCYEVKEDVFNMSMVSVKNNKGLYEIRDGKIYVNLKEINKRQLEELGVKYIDVCPYCTSCNNDLFYSYRKEGGTTNRHSAIIKLEDR